MGVYNKIDKLYNAYPFRVYDNVFTNFNEWSGMITISSKLQQLQNLLGNLLAGNKLYYSELLGIPNNFYINLYSNRFPCFCNSYIFNDIFSLKKIEFSQNGGFGTTTETFNNLKSVNKLLNSYSSWWPMIDYNNSWTYENDLIPYIFKYYNPKNYNHSYYYLWDSSELDFSLNDDTFAKPDKSFANLGLYHPEYGASIYKTSEPSNNDPYWLTLLINMTNFGYDTFNSSNAEFLESFTDYNKANLYSILWNFATLRGWNSFDIDVSYHGEANSYMNNRIISYIPKNANNLFLQLLIMYIYIMLSPLKHDINSSGGLLEIKYPICVKQTKNNGANAYNQSLNIIEETNPSYIDFDFLINDMVYNASISDYNGVTYSYLFPIYMIQKSFENLCKNWWPAPGENVGAPPYELIYTGNMLSRLNIVKYYTLNICFTGNGEDTVLPISEDIVKACINIPYNNTTVAEFSNEGHTPLYPNDFNSFGKYIFLEDIYANADDDGDHIIGENYNDVTFTYIHKPYIHSIMRRSESNYKEDLILLSIYEELYPNTVMAYSIYIDDFRDLEYRIDEGIDSEEAYASWAMNSVSNKYIFTENLISISGLGSYYLWEADYNYSRSTGGEYQYLITNTVNFWYLYYHSFEYDHYTAYCPYVATLSENMSPAYINTGNTLGRNYDGNILVAVRPNTNDTVVENFIEHYKNFLNNIPYADLPSMDLSDDWDFPEDARVNDDKYFTITSISQSSNTISFKASASNVYKTIYVSTDNGETWTSKTSSTGGTVLATLSCNETLLIRGTNSAYASTDSNYNYFVSTDYFTVSGNINSLIYGENFKTNTTISAQYAFARLFSNCSNLVDASNLLLPTNTTVRCYQYMFYQCLSLMAAPKLPATTLSNYCYYYMFRGCGNLTIAPELPATTLLSNSYSYMFYQCGNLNYIKALFTTTPSSTYTNNWVTGVAATGTFVKNSNATWNVVGVNGVPNANWTVEYANN